MIQWRKDQLPSARRNQEAVRMQAEQARAATAADHQAWLATVPAELRAHPQLQTQADQEDARD